MEKGCKKCGACCKVIAILVGKLTDDIKWAEAHNIQLVKHNEWEGNMVGFIPCRCKYLTEDNLCSIYEKRPLTCRISPREDWTKPPECKYDA